MLFRMPPLQAAGFAGDDLGKSKLLARKNHLALSGPIWMLIMFILLVILQLDSCAPFDG